MTEAEWLACADPTPMLHFLKANPASRKCRLLMSVCFHRHWRILPPAVRQWVVNSEDSAEGRSVFDHLEEEIAEAALFSPALFASLTFADQGILGSLIDLFRGDWALNEEIEGGDSSTWEAERVVQANHVRHIFGNPFRPYPAPTAWSANVVGLAQALYDGDDNRLILADALEEDGHAELAAHFRQEEWHPKGCWAVDLVLGKQ